VSPVTIGIGIEAASETGNATNAWPCGDDTATPRCRRWLCSRTQRLSWLALTPHLRARRETGAPGLPHAAPRFGLGRLVVDAAAIAIGPDHQSPGQLFHLV